MNAKVVKRRIAKATSWRLMSLVLTGGTAFLLTGSLAVVLGMSALEVVKFFLFMMHDHVWSTKIRVGK